MKLEEMLERQQGVVEMLERNEQARVSMIQAKIRAVLKTIGFTAEDGWVIVDSKWAPRVILSHPELPNEVQMGMSDSSLSTGELSLYPKGATCPSRVTGWYDISRVS